METTDKNVCRMLATLLAAHGVKRAVLSPGSRNVPMLIAMTAEPSISTEVVVDERSAAFMALGMAAVSGNPVALVCTSGTALLNYAPAVAEAYYRQIPLIVISADRPLRWIDQDDSQTIRQFGILAQIVKASYDICAETVTADDEWYANRVINDAMINATTGCKGPVHINLQIDEPLGGRSSEPLLQQRVIGAIGPSVIPDDRIASLRNIIATTPKVLVIAGFASPDPVLNSALSSLAALPNVAVMTESIANLSDTRFIGRVDTALGGLSASRQQCLAPDLVITMGGALVSRFVKQFIRNHRPEAHWHVGFTPNTVDCFKALTLRIEAHPGEFFARIGRIDPSEAVKSDYNKEWHDVYSGAVMRRDAFACNAPWSDLRAFSIIMSHLPEHCELQLSNGTPIRYAQLFAGSSAVRRIDCNRGVSGIDGSTSTAIGASLAYTGGPTVFVSGDMSAQYDIGALAFRDIPPRFKMIVLCNGGGGIFRFIGSTAALPEREALFADPVNLPIRDIASAYGFRCFSASSPDGLERVLPEFMADGDRPYILAVEDLPRQLSADLLKKYFTI